MTGSITGTGALVAAVALLGSCSSSKSAQTLLHEKDTICIGASFFVVGDTSSYPWVKLDPNTTCEDKGNLPSTYVNFEKVESFQPNCVCRYSAACRRKCSSGNESCLDACTD